MELWGRRWVERQSLGKLKDDFFFSSLFPHHISTKNNFTRQPEQRLSFGSIFKPAYSGDGIGHCFHVKHLEMNEFWQWHGWSVRLICGLINMINQCQESDQFRLNDTQERMHASICIPSTRLFLRALIQTKCQICPFFFFLLDNR